MLKNIILNVDSYKVSHQRQYPPETEHLFSFIESRGGQYETVLFFGLQAFIKEYLLTPFTQEHIDEAEEIILAHGFNFNRKSWEYILEKHNGYLPLEIRALPEGTVLPYKNALITVTNTDKNCPWLVSYIETALLRSVWYPTTVATLSHHVKKTISSYLKLTGDPSLVPFKLHDFGARGTSSEESAALGGMAHLVNFQGTDTLSGILAARKYYGATMPGFSIPAMEHSTVTSWGRENEEAAFANMMDNYGGEGKLVACVSDSYDIYHAVENIWCGSLLEKVKAMKGTVVIRPDSGKPVEVVMKIFEILERKLKNEIIINDKGYKVLPSYFRIIQGDGVTAVAIEGILSRMRDSSWAADNIVFGMGAGLLQRINRDTQKFAMKVSAIKTDHWSDVFKSPITDPGKKSKKGRLVLLRNEYGAYKTLGLSPEESYEDYEDENLLRPVYRNGALLTEQSFDEIRTRSEESL